MNPVPGTTFEGEYVDARGNRTVVVREAGPARRDRSDWALFALAVGTSVIGLIALISFLVSVAAAAAVLAPGIGITVKIASKRSGK